MRVVSTDPFSTVLRKINRAISKKQAPPFSSNKRILGSMLIAWLRGEHRAVIHQDNVDKGLFHWHMSTLRIATPSAIMETDAAGEFRVPDGLDILEGFLYSLESFLEV